MSFFRQDFDEVGLCNFLKDYGIDVAVADILEDNEIDGEVFLTLTNEEMKSLFPGKLGVAKKLIRIRDMVKDDTKNDSPSKASTVVLSPTPSDGSRAEYPSVSPCSSMSDLSSIDSCAATMANKFIIPAIWRPSIMNCIKKSTEEAQRQGLVPSIRNEIVCDLVTQMFSYDPKPQKEFCTKAAQMLVKKYPFMSDVGHKVSGFVRVELN